MSTRNSGIGFSSQRLRYGWVRHTAALSLSGVAGEALSAELKLYLGQILSSAGTDRRGSREKAITILRRIWASDTNELSALRIEGYDLLRMLPEPQHLAVHWGMTMAAYPFWGATGACVGRLLRLQGTASSMQITRRMQELYGDREIVARATRNVVRSFIDWGVLREEGPKGIYSAGMIQSVDNIRLIGWLAEATLRGSSSSSASLRELLKSPSLFAFQIQPVPARSLVTVSPRLDVIHHGLDEDLIVLKDLDLN